MLVKKDKPAVATPATPATPQGRSTAPRTVAKGPVTLTIPDVTGPVSSLEGGLLTFFGERKIGKTLVSSMFPGSYHLLFEPGGRGLEARKSDLPDWQTFVSLVDMVVKGQYSGQINTAVIDTVDIAYTRCMERVCFLNGCQHPQDNEDFGRTWSLVENEFTKQMNRLIAAGLGVIFISHADIRELMDADGMKFTKLVPTMGKQARRYAIGISDLIVFFGYQADGRVMTIQGSQTLEAGTRFKHNFWVKGKQYKERVHSIDMGDNEETAYDNLVAAFNNQQTTANTRAIKTVLSESSPKIGRRR